MKVPVVKKLVETHNIETLNEAENAIMEERQPDIKVEGDDEGEQLTHLLAAIAILEDMKANDLPFNKALRNYSQRVRKSIS